MKIYWVYFKLIAYLEVVHNPFANGGSTYVIDIKLVLKELPDDKL